jgi:tryptophanyl-tRNA synthetase
MSTTGGTPQGTVYVLDPPEVIKQKLLSAVTDSGRDVRRAPDKPGITNLVNILSVASAEAPEAIEARYGSSGYGRFKADVADAVIALFDPVRKRYQALRDDSGEVGRLLARGAEKARAASAPTLRQMYDRMGFVAPGSRS